MNRETKILSKKLIALFLSLALIIGLCPFSASYVKAEDISINLIDYQDTYYNGFNSNICVAKGTTIEVEGGESPTYFTMKSDLLREEGRSVTYNIDSFSQDSPKATVYYSDSKVFIKITVAGSEVYNSVLYVPQYVDLSQMPTIGINQTIGQEQFRGKYTEQYYRIDKSTLVGASRVFTLVLDIDDEEDEYYDIYNDTYLTLYDENKNMVDENDDADDGSEDMDSMIRFEKPESGELIVAVRDLEGEPFAAVELKLTNDAKSITKFEIVNPEVNTFYEGFNDNLIYATGTVIKATLDNGDVRTWIAGSYEDDYDEETEVCNINFDEIEAILSKGADGSVYAEYWLAYNPDSIKKIKLFTPIIKSLDEMPLFPEGEATITTAGQEGVVTYYRIPASDMRQLWSFTASCHSENPDYEGFDFELYNADGTFIKSYEQPFDEDTEELKDLKAKFEVPANETYIMGVSDYENSPQTITLNTSKEEVEETTTADTTETTTAVETTTVAPTTEAPTEAPTEATTVAPTTPKASSVVLKKPGKAKIKKVFKKKKSAKKLKLTLKKVKGAKGYQVAVFKTKKLAKKAKKMLYKKFSKKVKVTLNSKKLKGKKKLFLRARAYDTDGKTKKYGAWSNIKTVKAK